MNPEDMKLRTLRFGLATVQLAEKLSKPVTEKTLGNQLLRSGTSVGTNYRAACRARSRTEFVSKMKIVEEECDETLYWLSVLIGSGMIKPEDASKLEKAKQPLFCKFILPV